ncbi:hypothetical protein [Pantoea sp. NGS-ED-1003]|uniref:gp53-like domain-containing protein n=1 Tax=Pantoea sp. NGS-ED-1003 TaxID=1526743 RepID=UPI00068D1080|nr:hypothetical protein [Pantoea sp. NGS-ED-1003]
MHRIDTPTAQKDKFGAGKNGFTGGNPQTGELPTALDASFFDSLQEELSAVIESSGIALKKEDNAQLLKAIQAMITGLSLGTASKRNVGTGANQIPDMSTFVFNRSGTGIGNRKMTLQMPNGFILKVVNGAADANGYFYQAFDQPFPNALLFAWATERAPNGNLTQTSTVNASMEYSSLSYGSAQMRSLTSGGNIAALAGAVSFFAIGY